MDIRKQCAYPLLIWVAALAAVPTENEFDQEVSGSVEVVQELRLESLRPKMVFNDQHKDPFAPKITKQTVVAEQPPDNSSPVPPAPPAPVEPPKLEIQGIIWGGAFNQAIVNNLVVKVGDTVAGAKLTKIERSGITVLFEDKEFSYSSPAGGSPGVLDANLKGGSDGKQ